MFSLVFINIKIDCLLIGKFVGICVVAVITKLGTPGDLATEI